LRVVQLYGMTDKWLTVLLAEKGLRLADLARKCGVDKSVPTRWEQRGIPLVRVFQVEKETGIARQKLRPDFFEETA
jgi:transcriptional regulator with XRE-family HTH domain